MGAVALSKSIIDSLAAEARDKKRQFELSDIREPGLRIRAGQRATTWMLCSRLHNGKRTRIKLGSWPAMGIAAARQEARKKRVEILDGIDPNEERKIAAEQTKREAEASRTLSEILDLYELQHLRTLRRGVETRRAIDGKFGLLAKFRDSDIRSINSENVKRALQCNHARAPIAANRNLAYARAFFNWCKAELILSENPAADIRKPARERSRDRVHSIEELGEIWHSAEQLSYPFGSVIQLLIALPMRREEVKSIRVSELSFENDIPVIWTLPANRTKTGNALRIPLSSLARRIIKASINHSARPSASDFIFTTTGDTSVSGFSKAKLKLDCIVNEIRNAKRQSPTELDFEMEHWTIHDLRTTFCTLASDQLNADIAVVDRMLNHVASSTTSKIERIYNRSEMFEARRDVSDRWAKLLEDKVISAPATKEKALLTGHIDGQSDLSPAKQRSFGF